MRLSFSASVFLFFVAIGAAAQTKNETSKEEQVETAIDSSHGVVTEKSSKRIVETSIQLDSAAGTRMKSSRILTVETDRDITERSNILTMNPFKFAWAYNLGLVHKINDNVAIGGSFQIPTRFAFDNLTGWGILGELRYYPKGNNMRGFYIAPTFSVGSFDRESYRYGYDTTSTTNVRSYRPFTIGILTGWQWFMGDNFAMGLAVGVDKYMYPFGGVDMNDKNSDRYSYEYSYDGGETFPLIYRGIQPTVRYEIGFSW